MKSYKKILCFTMSLVMALSVCTFSIIAGAAGSAAGTVVFSEDFGDTVSSSPTSGTQILDNWNNWTARNYYTGSGTITTISENTIQKDGNN